ncbi:MAG: endonuclease VIII [Planctomycetes bacterium]|nr:endonuclease VIII [Planctomycetota bacterium]
MLELPETITLAKQLTQSFTGKTIVKAEAGLSPHKFAWYYGDPKSYQKILAGCVMGEAVAVGAFVKIAAGAAELYFHDGVNLRYYPDNAAAPAKCHMRIGFDDGSLLVATVEMYGGMYACPVGEFENKYYRIAADTPSPLDKNFKKRLAILAAEAPNNLSVKGLVATEQRIPGIGNGCLQDILFDARLNPQSKVRSLQPAHLDRLGLSVVKVLKKMIAGGGRDVEKDLYGQPGGYRTILTSRTVGEPCPGCGGTIVKKAYMGGNVYFCPACQPLEPDA